MTNETQHSQKGFLKAGGEQILPSYQSQSLLGLVGLVVDRSDRRALEEIHGERRVFKPKDGRHMLLAEYLTLLMDNELKHGGGDARALSLAERAYDLTLEKFINIPSGTSGSGPDCRNYYRTFLQAAQKSFRQKPTTSQLEEEARAGMLLKGLVARHFDLSMREARREAKPFWSRYQWRVNGRSFTVWMPQAMTGDERRAWLEANVPAQIFNDPQVGERIQEIIEQNLVKERFVNLDAVENSRAASATGTFHPEGDGWASSLGEMVAREKAQNIDQQRRAIRKLGPEKLARLVVQVFEDIAAEEYEQKRLGSQFGLSPATLSRFAGSDWHRTESSETPVPDLWRNTAQVISQIPVFREVAEEVGMLDMIKAVRGDSHE